MSQVFTEAMRRVAGDRVNLDSVIKYWYHFAIMFEAVFILTTIDSGTRIGRFLLQEFGGRLWPKFGRTDWFPGSLLATILIVVAWAYFIWTGNVGSIWPLFGVANQLLAVVALAVATTIVINIGRQRYAWITFLPLCFLSVTTLTAGWLNITDNYWPMATGADAAQHLQGWVNTLCTGVMMSCAVIILITTSLRSLAVLTGRMRVLALS
jgi:carbon starvation protein